MQPAAASRVERLIDRTASRNGWLLYTAMVLMLIWFAAEVTVGVLWVSGSL